MLERYPPVEITAEQYETQVVDWLRTQESFDSFQVTHREKLPGTAGEYTFDGIARFEILGGAQFLVLIECKRHRRPVERLHVMALHQKLRDVGAHKALIFSTGGFQRGAIEYAHAHGIAAVHFADGRAGWMARSRTQIDLQAPPDLDLYSGWLVTPSGPSSVRQSRFTADTLHAWLND